MFTISTTNKAIHWSLASLLLSVFAIGAGSFLITPLLPIYFVESVANGGLSWSRADTFSVFGTFLALIYIAPFIGGLFGDFVIGKQPTALCGYCLIGLGLFLLNSFTSYNGVLLSLLALGLGLGCVKVTLTAAVGRLPQEIRQRGYEYHYMATCFGFFAGGLLSNPIFNVFGISGVIVITVCLTVLSIIFFLLFSLLGNHSNALSSEPQTTGKDKPSSSRPSNPLAFFILVLLGVPFFICSNQLSTGMPIFLHQCVDRSLGGWTVPTLWFGAIGSFTMILISPWLRKSWAARYPHAKAIEALKLSAGFVIIAAAFAITATFAAFNTPNLSFTAIPLMLGVHLICFVADFHVRPVLYASATSLMPSRYHTLSTALAYSCVGLGGKLAGTLASYVDTIGFSMIFAICSVMAVFCGIITFFWWKREVQPDPGLSAAHEGAFSHSEETTHTAFP